MSFDSCSVSEKYSSDIAILQLWKPLFTQSRKIWDKIAHFEIHNDEEYHSKPFHDSDKNLSIYVVMLLVNYASTLSDTESLIILNMPATNCDLLLELLLHLCKFWISIKFFYGSLAFYTCLSNRDYNHNEKTVFISNYLENIQYT